MYGLRRFIQSVGIIWGIVTLLFVIFYALGDPTAYIVGDQADEATKAAIRKKYELDKPLYVQYGNYLNDLSPLGAVDSTYESPYIPIFSYAFVLKWPNLGRSLQSRQPVGELLRNRIVGTAILALAALSFSALIGIILGVFAALRHQTWVDRLILSSSVLGISAPSFFIGVLVAWIFAVEWREFTGLNVTGYLWEPHIFDTGHHLVLKNLFLPALALGIRPLAVFIQLTRSSMIEVLGSDFIRTARAKGLSDFQVIFRHALRNALNPVLTAVTGWLASLLAGAFFIEYIFNWKGIGKLMIDSLNTNDFPVILGCALTIGIFFVVINILTDVLYKVLDPRVKLE
ncbi:MAG: ABC transporter permease [Bacteroidota bacterium]